MRIPPPIISVLLAFAVSGSVAFGHGGTTGPAGGGSPGYLGPGGGGRGPVAGPVIGTSPQSGSPGSAGPIAPMPNGGEPRPPLPPWPVIARSGTGDRSRAITPGRSWRRDDEDALADWEVWWELNADRYLALKLRVRGVPSVAAGEDPFLGATVPSEGAPPASLDVIRREVVPSLLLAMKDGFHDARIQAVLSLGKVADRNHVASRVTLLTLLADRDHRIREAACLALGLLGDRAVVPDLLAIADNRAAGRTLCGLGDADIPARERALAAIALGLLGSRVGAPSDAGVLPALLRLAKSGAANAEVSLGAALALAFVGTPESVPALVGILEDGGVDARIRARIAFALGRLDAKPAIPALVKALVYDEAIVARAAAVSLGLLATRNDKGLVRMLIRQAAGAGDRATRNLCLVALGEIGDSNGKAFLLHTLRTGPFTDRSFAALALGVMGRRFPEERAELGTALLAAFRATTDSARACAAISLALAGFGPAKDAIRAALVDAGSPTMKSHLGIALGMLDDQTAIPALRDLVARSHDEILLYRAALALGLLRDNGAVELLGRIIRESSGSQELRGAAIRALGAIGDRRAVPTLCTLVNDAQDDVQAQTRADAAAALGLLGDKDELPLLAALAANSSENAHDDLLDLVLAWR